MADIFISHSGSDNEVAAAIYERIRRERPSWSLFYDKDNIRAGQRWQEHLREELTSCRVVLALLSRTWLGSSWCFAEAVTATFRGKDVVGIETEDLTGDDLARAPPILHERQRVRLRDGDDRAWREILEALDRSGLDPNDWFPIPPNVGPYPGLVPFDEKDAGVFFGRKQEITEYLGILDTLRGPDRSQVLVISGGSGSGKSSLLRAGLIPRLRRKPDWIVISPFEVAREPIRDLLVRLSEALAGLGIPAEGLDLTKPPDDPAALAQILDEALRRLEQQAAGAWVLQVINSSPGDLAPVFNGMLEKATRLCEAAFGLMSTYDGEQYHTVATHGVGPELAEFMRVPPHPDPESALGRIERGEDLVLFDDIADIDVYRKGAPRLRAIVDLGGARSYVMVALRKDRKLLGVIAAYRQEVRPFSDKQFGLLQNFAAQAVIAMENARLLGELRQRTEEVGELNRDLEARVASQVEELGRVGRLKRFLAPQLAELIVSQGDEQILESHRREIVVVFCDLRGYTAFTETAEPEEVLDFLGQYHGALGPLVSQFEGTLDQFSGDGIMVFFNDPVRCPNPAERAVKMAMAMRDSSRELIAAWRRHGCELGFGAGIAQGFATLGQIGFSERSGYTAIGTVCNLAARLCAEAKDGQILVSSRIAEAVEAVARLEDLGNLELKGLRRPVAAFNVAQSTSPAEARPNLTVVSSAPGA